MSERHEPGHSAPSPRVDGGQIGSLLRLAGPREAVPAERTLRVRGAVHAEWRRATRVRARRQVVRWSLGACAVAAAVAFAVRGGVRPVRVAPDPRIELASIKMLRGHVGPIAASRNGAFPVAWHVGDRVRSGEGIDTTGGGGAALRLARGAVVRVDGGTRMRLLSEDTIALDAGAVYVDAGVDPRAVEVRTPLGVARDIGTRFEVRLGESSLRVRVRDGLVRLTQGDQSHNAARGEEVTLSQNGALVRRTVPLFGPEWAWTLAAVESFALEGRTLREFLAWITEENGWRLAYADATVRDKAAKTVLHGSIDGLSPEDALMAVLPASGVGHRLEDGVLRIALAAGETKY